MYLWWTDLDKGSKPFNGKIIAFLTNSAGTTWYTHTKEWNLTLTHTVYKINSKEIKVLSVRTKTTELSVKT